MKYIKSGLVLLSLALLVSFAAPADAALSGDQKEEVENVVRTLLLEKEPDLIMKAAEEMQRRAHEKSNEENAKAIKENEKELYHNSEDPVLGNKKGDVVVVEFFDYQCGHCKAVYDTLVQLAKKDRNVKIVFKEYPILGPTSKHASVVALASLKQGKYFQFHEAVMHTRQRISDNYIFSIAEKIGLDMEKLKKDMKDKNIEKIITNNNKLGNKVGARGTPSFIIDGQVFPGALPLEQIEDIIEKIRKSK